MDTNRELYKAGLLLHGHKCPDGNRGGRSDNPAILTELRYKLILNNPEPPEKLSELHELCLKWGTVTNTIYHQRYDAAVRTCD